MKDIVSRSDALDKRIKKNANIEASIEALTKTGKTNRRLINWVIVSIFFEIILTFVVVFAVIRTSQNSIRIERNHDILVSGCRTGNDFRVTEKSLWNYILAIPSDATPTIDQQKRIDAFKLYLDKNFAPRDCNNL